MNVNAFLSVFGRGNSSAFGGESDSALVSPSLNQIEEDESSILQSILENNRSSVNNE